MSVLMFLPEAMNNSVVRVPSPKEFFMFSVPAILYSINNNIVVHIQTFVDPASFQVLLVNINNVLYQKYLTEVWP